MDLNADERDLLLAALVRDADRARPSTTSGSTCSFASWAAITDTAFVSGRIPATIAGDARTLDVLEYPTDETRVTSDVETTGP